jgi:4-amino-4-deoxy-L-arabinose transferase-like glycosyltransferase
VQRSEAGWFRPAFALVALLTLLRWGLLAFDRTDLYVDESQYWLWGQHFDFGYYSKPPLIGWLIGAVTTLAGSDSVFWVRMPGALLHGATALILAAWANRAMGRREAVLVAALYATLPMVALGSLLISTDTVMAPFYAAALYAFHRLTETRAPRFALLAGAAIGAAFMAKYAAVYFLIGVALIQLSPAHRIGWRNAALLLLGFAVVISPNILWNLSHQLTTFSHTVDNVGWLRASGGPRLNAGSMAEFIASQAAVVGPVVFAALLIALRRLPPFAAFVIPPLLVVSVQALLGEAQANWAVAAYFAGSLLAVQILRNHPRWAAASFAINAVICLALPLLTIFTSLSFPNGKPLLDRQLGRASMSRQIIALAHDNGDIPVLAESRDILADLFYTGQNAGLTYYAPRPKGRAENHYEQRYPLPRGLQGKLLLITSEPPACAGDVLPLDAKGGAYAKKHLAGYIVEAACVDK